MNIWCLEPVSWLRQLTDLNPGSLKSGFLLLSGLWGYAIMHTWAGDPRDSGEIHEETGPPKRRRTGGVEGLLQRQPQVHTPTVTLVTCGHFWVSSRVVKSKQ